MHNCVLRLPCLSQTIYWVVFLCLADSSVPNYCRFKRETLRGAGKNKQTKNATIKSTIWKSTASALIIYIPATTTTSDFEWSVCDRLFKLSRHHCALHCKQNLGSRLAEYAHPDDSTGKHARKPVWVQFQQKDRGHDLRAEADTGEMQRTGHSSKCSFRRPDQGLWYCQP